MTDKRPETERSVNPTRDLPRHDKGAAPWEQRLILTVPVYSWSIWTFKDIFRSSWSARP